MFNLRFVSGNRELLMGHEQSAYKITKISGIDGIDVDITLSQGFDQIGDTIENMSVGSRDINIIGRIDNFLPDQLRELNYMFSPMTTVRLYFEEKYWIDCAIKTSPVFSYNLRSVKFSVSLVAAYPFWKSIIENRFELGGLEGGFNFPVSYNVTHNFATRSQDLVINCINNGNTKVDYIAEFRVESGTVNGVSITNAQNQKSTIIHTAISSGDSVKVFRENNILRVTKTTGETVTDIFSDLDEDSNLFFMEVGDNVIRADKLAGAGTLICVVSFYDTVTGVRYGI